MESDSIQKEDLKDEMRNVIEEARMVIPGIQALFGFQTMAVFNNRYKELPSSGVCAHLIGLGLLAVAIALLMTPAAYHRLAERGQVSRRMIDLSSRLITAGMIPLMLGIALDVYVVLLAAIQQVWVAASGGILALFVLAALWFVFPAEMRKSNSVRGNPM